MEQNYFDSISKGIGLSLNEALIDPFFYYRLRLNKYQSYQDLNGKSYFGLDVNSFHQIEVFVDGHKKQKFTYFDLNPENVLFPLYPSALLNKVKPLSNIVVRTKEKGRVSFTFQSESNMSLDDIISFELMMLDENLLISSVNAYQKPLSLKRTDTVLIEQYVNDYR
ncbi:hypothetical protein [Flavobacterium sp.]|jgi:hypothetical protein|uniref:hypothetical protein n=1 Tax=Flavobacterium sp. TaxID=239 RepID=UPI0037C0FB45